MESDRVLAAAMSRLDLLRKRGAFDPYNLDSRPTSKQQDIIEDFGKIPQQWIRAGNQSGKSQVCARNLTWAMTGTHPFWTKPSDWGEEPLLAIVTSATGKQIEDSLMPKIVSFLDPGSYKIVRVGNIVQRIELDNGNRIIFQSLEQPAEAQRRLQSYVAHIAWSDEMPPTMGIVRELLIRVQSRNGYFMASFTPTILNIEIQRYVDGLHGPGAKVYRLKMLDNPLYQDPKRKQELLDQYSYLPEEQQRMIFEGDWLSAENQVYYFDYAKMVEMPDGYSPMWRHVEAVDPALKSALGLTVWAECPRTNTWYCVVAEYVKGILVPTELVRHVKERTAHYNIVRRIADPHEVWYIQTAASMGINYMGVYKKGERKSELIKQLQQKLGSGTVRISPPCQLLIQELQVCRWSDRADGKIVNASSYHLLDSSQYFCDNIPKEESKGLIKSGNWDEWLYQANEKRKQKVEKEKTRNEKIQIRKSGRSRWK